MRFWGLYKNRKRLGEQGQSTIEFALTLVLLLGFVLFYIQLSLVMAFGNYAHYATFMAARAYLSAGHSKSDQAERAQAVLTRMLKKPSGNMDRFPSIAKGEGGDGTLTGASISEPEQFKETDPGSSWMQGVRYAFKSRLFLLPMGRKQQKGGASSITLKSESWLGREPSTMDCLIQMKGRIYDNGC